MADVMIGIDPHKSSHTAVAIGPGEEPLGELQVRACPSQAGQLLAWAQKWPERAWAIEGAAGLGNLLAQQLVAAGERVLDVPPKLAARVRLLQSGNTSKNDPNDAYSVAAAALRSKGRPGDRRHRDRRRPPGVPVPWPGPLRLLERHRPGRGVLRRPQEDLPAVAARQPAGQPRHPHGRDQPDPAQAQPRPPFYEKKVAEGKTHKEALRALKRRISDAIYAALAADARQAAAACPEDPGGQPGNHSASRAAGSHPADRHFGQATPGPRHHPTAAASSQGTARHSPVAATLPPAKPQVQVERPQRSEDERPGGAARRRQYSAARKALVHPRTRR